jgi:hypothetical protein
MSNSVLKFAKDFERLKSEYQATEAPDLRIMLLLRFWPGLEVYRDNKLFASYFEEYIPLLLDLINHNSLIDLTISELESLRKQLLIIKKYEPTASSALKQVALSLAAAYFYVGATNKGLAVFDGVGAGLEHANLANNVTDYASEFELFQRLCDKVRQANPGLYNLLFPILIEWESIRESIDHENINCLFVEKDDLDNSHRGRLKQLHGMVEEFGKSAIIDEITFDNIIVKPDDPFVGVAYDALKAVRSMLKSSGYMKGNSRYFHAHYSIIGSQDSFTGDSIGLSIALITYIQLIKDRDERHNKYLAADTAFTGGITSSGNIVPVNEESLLYKITRVFHSPIKHLVVPAANYDKAAECLESLKSNYPNRKLHIIPVEHFFDLKENHNIIRPEKVCMGEFIAKKAYRYSRMVKIQIPILLLLVYLLLCLVYPKAGFWFDWRIDHIEVSSYHIKAVNRSGNTLWISNEFEQPLLTQVYNTDAKTPDSYWIVDADNDGKDELFFIPHHENPVIDLYFFDNNGKILWGRSTNIKTGVTKDQYNHFETPVLMPYIEASGKVHVITLLFSSPPARAQLNLFNSKGEHISGPYIHPGALSLSKSIQVDLDNDGNREIILGGTNNWQNGAGIVVLDPHNLTGVCPPYNNPYFQKSDYSKGTQLYYVAFPETPLSQDPEIHTSFRGINYDNENNEFEIEIKEAYGLTVEGRQLVDENRPQVFYILDSNFIPIRVFTPDATRAFINDLLLATDRDPIMNLPALLDSLKSEIIVYHGDTIVHHEAAGIFFK